MPVFAFAIGVATRDGQGNCIDCFFPAPQKEPRGALGDAIAKSFSPGTTTMRAEQLRSFVLNHQSALAPVLETERELIATLLP
ncbi:MAG: hypothetical protein OXU72_05870, partial [Gammaproteobacteria bacterium]|nr:hypothetical protein [Gammaproteobacteria bacterium]